MLGILKERATGRAPAPQLKVLALIKKSFSIMVNSVQAKSYLARAVESFCLDLNKEDSTPLLEADVVANIYYHLRLYGVPPSNLFINTRLCDHSPRSRKYDLVFGSLEPSRACVAPTLVVQVKAFQRYGLSTQQHRRRFQGIIESDIPSLIDVEDSLPKGRVELVSDLYLTSESNGYLTGTWYGESKIEVLKAACYKENIELWWVRPGEDGKISLQIVCSTVNNTVA